MLTEAERTFIKYIDRQNLRISYYVVGKGLSSRDYKNQKFHGIAKFKKSHLIVRVGEAVYSLLTLHRGDLEAHAPHVFRHRIQC